jgi:hypothetical protein
MILIDTFKRERVRYPHHAELRAYVVASAQGEVLEPARFTLEPAPYPPLARQYGQPTQPEYRFHIS